MFRRPLPVDLDALVDVEPTALELRVDEALAVANDALAKAKHRSDANRRTMTYLADTVERLAGENRTTVARTTHNDNRIGTLTSDLAALTSRVADDAHEHPTEADDALAAWQAGVEEQLAAHSSGLQTWLRERGSDNRHRLDVSSKLDVLIEALRQYQSKHDDLASTVGGRLDTIDTCIDSLARRVSDFEDEPGPDLPSEYLIDPMEAGDRIGAAFEQRVEEASERPIRYCRNEFPHPPHVTAYKASADEWTEAQCPGVESYTPSPPAPWDEPVPEPEPTITLEEQQERPLQEDGELEARLHITTSRGDEHSWYRRYTGTAPTEEQREFLSFPPRPGTWQRQRYDPDGNLVSETTGPLPPSRIPAVWQDPEPQPTDNEGMPLRIPYDDLDNADAVPLDATSAGLDAPTPTLWQRRVLASILQAHRSGHPFITIAGPVAAGKTWLMNELRRRGYPEPDAVWVEWAERWALPGDQLAPLGSTESDAAARLPRVEASFVREVEAHRETREKLTEAVGRLAQIETAVRNEPAETAARLIRELLDSA
jgi:hypothetical protein